MKKSKVNYYDGWIWLALVTISFLFMLSVKLFAGWAIPWWIVTLPLWVLPALVLCIVGVCLTVFMGVGVVTILLDIFWWIVGERNDDDNDDYDD
jgi:hypothetical protein